jgi:threonine synthase
VKPAEGYGKDAATKGIEVCELWAGATLAFKDLGMSVLGNLLNYFLEQDKANMIILVGTSGDTGSAAIEALGGLSSVEIVTLYPKDRCSAVQELQMTRGSESYENSTLIRVEGTSDDLDEPIEAILHDVKIKHELNIGSVNSVNIVRLLVQTVHFFYSYIQLQPEVNQVVSFAVPTGAGGHVTAGVIAAHMGLPVQSLLVATNANDIFHRFLLDNDAMVTDMVDTNSPSMDVQVGDMSCVTCDVFRVMCDV